MKSKISPKLNVRSHNAVITFSMSVNYCAIVRDQCDIALVLLPSSKLSAPASTRAAYSPTLKPAVATQDSSACNSRAVFNMSMVMMTMKVIKEVLMMVVMMTRVIEQEFLVLGVVS